MRNIVRSTPLPLLRVILSLFPSASALAFTTLSCLLTSKLLGLVCCDLRTKQMYRIRDNDGSSYGSYLVVWGSSILWVKNYLTVGGLVETISPASKHDVTMWRNVGAQNGYPRKTKLYPCMELRHPLKKNCNEAQGLNGWSKQIVMTTSLHFPMLSKYVPI